MVYFNQVNVSGGHICGTFLHLDAISVYVSVLSESDDDIKHLR